MRRLATVAAIVAVVSVAGAAPAQADPARPTNFRSQVSEVVPAVEVARFEVTGGDSFLGVEVEPGHVVEVPGLQGEPYVRIEEDGSVLVNQRSPTRWLSEDRYGQVTLPSDASPDAPPEWVEVASDGSFAWHDHRIHWMTPNQPPPVVQGEAVEVLRWTVPIIVDGTPAEVRGVLDWLPPVSPLPALLMGLAAAAVPLLLWRWRADLAGPVAVTIGAAAALTVGIAQVAAAPPGAGGEVLAWGPPAVALVCGLAAPALARRTNLADLPVVAGSVLLIIWVLLRLPTLWMPSLTSALPGGLERVLVAVAGGNALAALTVVFLGRRPAIRPA